MNEIDAKRYQIPRRVTEGIRMLGLSGRQLIWMGLIILIVVFIFRYTGLPTGAKLVISTFLLAGNYFGMTMELGNGLRMFEFIRVYLWFQFFEQKEYTLVSSSGSDLNRREIKYQKPNSINEEKENELEGDTYAGGVGSIWPNYERVNLTEIPNSEEGLEGFEQFMPKPKVLNRKETY